VVVFLYGKPPLIAVPYIYMGRRATLLTRQASQAFTIPFPPCYRVTAYI